MFYVIYIAVIVFALYLIFHDRPEGEGQRRKPQARVSWPVMEDQIQRKNDDGYVDDVEHVH